MKNKDGLTVDTKDALFRLLRFSLTESDARLASEALMERYGSAFVIADVPIEKLAETEGMNMKSATLLKLCFLLKSRAATDGFEFGKVHSDSEIEDYLRGLFIGLENENVYMITIDSCGRTVSCDFLGEGIVSASDIYPRRLLEVALKKNAAEIIIAHNHPRGKAEASNEDRETTRVLFSVMLSAGIKLRAHYVVACGDVHEIMWETTVNDAR